MKDYKRYFDKIMFYNNWSYNFEQIPTKATNAEYVLGKKLDEMGDYVYKLDVHDNITDYGVGNICNKYLIGDGFDDVKLYKQVFEDIFGRKEWVNEKFTLGCRSENTLFKKIDKLVKDEELVIFQPSDWECDIIESCSSYEELKMKCDISNISEDIMFSHILYLKFGGNFLCRKVPVMDIDFESGEALDAIKVWLSSKRIVRYCLNNVNKSNMNFQVVGHVPVVVRKCIEFLSMTYESPFDS